MAARTLMGDSLGFHIMFALLGVGLPFLMSIFELIGIWRKDADFYRAARGLSFAVATLFVTGAISGTIISFQMNLLWPHFMEFASPIIGLPFALEGFAFLIEALFLGIYLYSWDRLPKWIHWLCSIPVWLASFSSAFLITTVNGWMNTPQGFTLNADGTVSNINPWAALWNPAAPHEILHSVLAYYLTTCFALAAVYAWQLHRRHIRLDAAQSGYYKKLTVFLLAFSLALATAVGLAGDENGKFIAQNEPIKFAAAESVYITGPYTPLIFGGYVVPAKDNPQIHYALTFPKVLSWLAFGNSSAVVRGLDAFNPAHWPPLFVHYFLNIMIVIGVYLGFVPSLFLLLWWRKKTWAFSRPMLWLIILGCPLAFAAVECGWMLTEIGRQPFIIKDIMTTAQAATDNQSVFAFAWIFPSLYMILFALTWWILHAHYRKPKDFGAIQK